MGASHSRNHDWDMDRRGHGGMKSSTTTRSDFGNNNCPANSYAHKLRSVSTNDALSDGNGNRNSTQSGSSSISTSSSFRSKMSLLKKPSFNSTRTNTNDKSERKISKPAGTTTSKSTVVNSLMTNVSSGTNAPSYPYPRSHSTNLVLPSPVANTTNSSTNSALRRPVAVNRKGQMAMGIGLGYGRSGLQIPSPVPSVSEPSVSEENMSNAEPDTKGIAAGGGEQLQHVDSVSTLDSTSRIGSGLIAPAKPCSASPVISSNRTAVGYSASTRPFTQPSAVSSIKPERRLQFGYASGIRASSAPPVKATESIEDGRRLAEAEAGGVDIDSGQQPSRVEGTVAQATAAGPAVCRIKRPDSLLEKSSSAWSSQRYSSKLRYKGEEEAPLAESECFVVENSPAVELPPFMLHNTMRTVQNRTGGDELESNNNKEAENLSKMGAPTGVATRLQSRLKNPSAYEQRQRFIYGRYPATSGAVKSGQKLATGPPLAATKTQMDSPKLAKTNMDQKEIRGKGEEKERELQDSGVKVDCGGGSGSGSETNGSKATSPEGSLHRGLIDDEIRDQPELTIGRSEGSIAEPASQITTIQEEIHQVECATGPVRLRDRGRRRSAASGVTNRMVESYDSTMSSLSIDSQDLMIDYESLDQADDEGADLIAPTAAISECASVHSSLGRRSSANSQSGTGVGSLGRAKKNTSTSTGGGGGGSKRASVDVDTVMGELASLMNETERGSNQSQQRQRALSDYQSPSPSSGHHQSYQSPSHYNRILRPPLSLECAGLSTVTLDQQAYRHMVQDVTVMKTLLLRLKRSLQETETANPFESSLTLKNGLAKSALMEMEMQKNEERLAQLTKDDLKQENAALRTQIAVMRQQLEEQSRIIQCLQHQLKHCRQRPLRKAESVGDSGVPKENEEKNERATEATATTNGAGKESSTAV